MKSKYAWITSHACRRSFCTNEFLAGTPEDNYRINDLSIAGNADREKVLTTVAATAIDFIKDHPDAISGSAYFS